MAPGEIYRLAKQKRLVHNEVLRVCIGHAARPAVGYCVSLYLDYANLAEHAERRRSVPLAIFGFNALSQSDYRECFAAARQRCDGLSGNSQRALMLQSAIILMGRPECVVLDLDSESCAHPLLQKLGVIEVIAAIKQYDGSGLHGPEGVVTNVAIEKHLAAIKQGASYQPNWICTSSPTQHPTWRVALAREVLRSTGVTVAP